MNTYWIESRELSLVADVLEVQDWWQAVYEEGIECALVIAPTRSKARYLFCQEYDLDFADIATCRLVQKQVSHDSEVIHWSEQPPNIYEDDLWLAFARKFWEPESWQLYNEIFPEYQQVDGNGG